MVAAQALRRPSSAVVGQQRRHPRAHPRRSRPSRTRSPRPAARRGCSSPTARRPPRAASRCRTPRRRPSAAARARGRGGLSVTTTWWRAPPDGIRTPAAAPTAARRRAAGQHDPARGDVAGRGADAGHRDRPSTTSPVNAVRSQTRTPGGEQRRGVGEHVARRVDVAVPGGVRRRPASAPAPSPGSSSSTSSRSDPPHVEAEPPAASRSGRAPRATSALGEARHEVALRDEARVDAEQVLLPGVEVAAEQPEPDGRLGAALGAHHARRRASWRPGPRVSPLEQHDVAEAGSAQEPRAPGADRAAADDDGIGAARHTLVMLASAGID